MKSRVFNTTFEVSMRVLILLDIYKSPLDEDQIIYLDFFTIYSKNYAIGNENLNGDSEFMLNQFTAQRTLIRDSIKELVLSGHINVTNTKKGFVYSINNKGLKLCTNMNTNYSVTYKENATLVKKVFRNANIKKIKSYAREMEEQTNGKN